MSRLVEARLVNEPFGDPGVFVDFRFARRALLFDLGDLAPLSSRELLRVSHVFVSHLHLDHFVGFDRLLRVNLHQHRTLAITGPPGLTDAVEAKLRGYRWNLLDENSPDFVITTADWCEGFGTAARFRARAAFRRENSRAPRPDGNVVHSEGDFRIECVAFDHGIPSLGFALVEAVRVNVIKARLDALGLPVGPWLNSAKAAFRRGSLADSVIAGTSEMGITQLLEQGVFRLEPGQRLAYATDLLFSPANAERLRQLAANADQLVIEAVFREVDTELAARKFHLTAAQAGALARSAGARRATPMHFSPRYLEAPDLLVDEFTAAFTGRSESEQRHR